MKHGFMSTTCKQVNNLQNIAVKMIRDPRKRVKVARKSKSCSLFSSIIVGVVHSEFLPDGEMVNKEYYLSVMRHLRESIRRKWPDLRKDNSWSLHHDNAPSHTSISVRKFLAKNSTNVIDQAPYSPDMAPYDFVLFSKLKLPLQSRRFDSIEVIKGNSQKELKTILQRLKSVLKIGRSIGRGLF